MIEEIEYALIQKHTTWEYIRAGTGILILAIMPIAFVFIFKFRESDDRKSSISWERDNNG